MIDDIRFRQHTDILFKPGEDIETTPDKARLLHAAVGVSGESGELLDAVKKHWAYGQQLDKENVLEECGDILFYVDQALACIGRTIPEAREHNYEKLRRRYPEGYSDQAAKDRADKNTQGDTECFVH